MRSAWAVIALLGISAGGYWLVGLETALWAAAEVRSRGLAGGVPEVPTLGAWSLVALVIGLATTGFLLSRRTRAPTRRR